MEVIAHMKLPDTWGAAKFIKNMINHFVLNVKIQVISNLSSIAWITGHDHPPAIPSSSHGCYMKAFFPFFINPLIRKWFTDFVWLLCVRSSCSDEAYHVRKVSWKKIHQQFTRNTKYTDILSALRKRKSFFLEHAGDLHINMLRRRVKSTQSPAHSFFVGEHVETTTHYNTLLPLHYMAEPWPRLLT